MTDSEPSEAAQQFLIQLFEQTKGDGSIQVSMYDIGELLGMDRDTASTVAQELMGLQLVEIRTLSGGIGIVAAIPSNSRPSRNTDAVDRRTSLVIDARRRIQTLR